MFDQTELEIMQNWKGDIKKPVVSICSITYNHEKYIAEAIESFLMQKTDFPFEIVIGEDCSTDNTRKIIEEYVEKYPNIIRLIVSEDNVGMMKNFIRTLQACTGKYIAICEGDDYWTNEKKLQLQIEEMKKFPDVNMSFHPAYELKDGQRTGILLSDYEENNKIFTTSEVIQGEGHFSPTASLIIKKDAINDLPNFCYKSPIGDYMIQIFASLSAGALYISSPMSIYRRGHEGSFSSIDRNVSKEQYITEEVRARLATIDLLENINNYLNQQYNDIFTREITKRFFMLSLFYLENGKIDEFKKEIEKSFEKNKETTLSHQIFYHFRKFPRILKTIYQRRKIIKIISWDKWR